MEVRPVSGSDMLRTVRLRTSDTQIREVVITATQVRGPVSGVHIGRDAMNHIQPSSFGDLLELLPGGRASDPSFFSSNHIHLREIGTSNSDYQTTSLGVSFVMDGIPMSNDAGMTYNSGTTVGNNISLNRGVDMRTMPTDEVASVEIQQGIPSVEYGDLTSGLIKIKRKEGGRNLEARFKADLGSQLLYVGKGFEWGAPADLLTMNVGATWLNSHDDPRNTRLGLPLHVGRIARLHRLFRPPKKRPGYRRRPGGHPPRTLQIELQQRRRGGEFHRRIQGCEFFPQLRFFRFRLFRIRPDRPLALPSEQRQRPYTHGSRRGRLRYGSAAGPL